MKFTIFFISILVLFNCKESKKQTYEPTAVVHQQEIQDHQGEKLMKMYCYACHDATTPEDKRLAPPMVAIKRRYITKNTRKEDFVKDMQNWVKNPSEEKAKMYGAVQRFGIMVKMGYAYEDIKAIAEYMYDHELEKPDWFEEHYQRGMGRCKKSNP
ncbi:c-type cytochrome [Hyunsoonleella rubra]|uniref:C-type cytochrome n=1 Tax=Hyunsoonleella rubra TaxID=1737062 RepID=A0ABW5T603_9FLAO